MWFAMILLYFSSFIYSIKYLNSKIINFDIKSTTYATIGTMFGICGIISGMAWAYFDWGKVWINDAKLNGTLYAILCYLAYFVLRGSINSYTKKTILSSSYNILCFFMIIIFVFILPNFDTSIHPKNVIFSAKNINNSIRLVLYSATIGWILFAYSISNILIRIKKLETND